MNGTTAETLQSFSGTTIGPGPSVVQVASYGSGTATLVLGAISRNPGGTIQFASGTATEIITTTTQNTNGILGAWATISSGDWATNTGVASAEGGYEIDRYSGYVNDYTNSAGTTPTSNFGWSPGNNTSTISIVANTTDVIASGSTTNSLRFNTSPNYSISLAGDNTITSGGILVAGTVGSASMSIVGSGTLTAAGRSQRTNHHEYERRHTNDCSQDTRHRQRHDGFNGRGKG